MKKLFAVGIFCLFVASSQHALASVQIAGGSSLLTQSYADQLGTWLGEGDLTITNIYTKQSGDRSGDFHAAADFKGRTFVLIEVPANTADDRRTLLINNPYQIIGGYNPQSWDSSTDYHYTPLDPQRTAFLFNLTTTEIQRQSLTSETGINGQYQTYNDFAFGPIFGGGWDIWINGDLSTGGAYNWSYGGTVESNNILSGPSHHHTFTALGSIEVFTITNGIAGVVPEMDSVVVWSILGLATAGYVWCGRQRSSVV
jgi:hypothetical protein